MNGKGRRTGVFGGSFDPIHLGHLLIALDALENCRLDRVLFVPAAQSPLKEEVPGAPARHRLGMVNAATQAYPAFEVLESELDAGGVSYTIDTVERLRAACPEDELHLIIGADQAEQLGEWHRIEELAALVHFLIVERPGFDAGRAPRQDIPGLRLERVDGHLFEISSTEVRERVREARPIDFLVHPRVNDYINQHQLYR